MQVRAAAVQTVGLWLCEPGVLGVLAGSAPLAAHAADWAEAVGNALLDPAHAVCARAHAAVRCDSLRGLAGSCSGMSARSMSAGVCSSLQVKLPHSVTLTNALSEAAHLSPWILSSIQGTCVCATTHLVGGFSVASALSTPLMPCTCGPAC